MQVVMFHMFFPKIWESAHYADILRVNTQNTNDDKLKLVI